MNDLRKFSITPAVLEEICRIARHNPDAASMANEELEVQPGTEGLTNGPYYMPVSTEMCRAAKKPKKIWNAFLKMNIYNFVYVSTKPGFYSFIAKAYNGKLFSVDIKKESWLSYKKALEQALVGLADQILEIKMLEAAAAQKEQEERSARMRERLGDVKLDIPAGVEMNDELIDSIANVLEQIKDTNLQDDTVVDTVMSTPPVDEYKEAVTLMDQCKEPPLVPYDPTIHNEPDQLKVNPGILDKPLTVDVEKFLTEPQV